MGAFKDVAVQGRAHVQKSQHCILIRTIAPHWDSLDAADRKFLKEVLQKDSPIGPVSICRGLKAVGINVKHRSYVTTHRSGECCCKEAPPWVK